MRPIQPVPPKKPTRRYWQGLTWIFAVLCFVVGTWIGWNHNANLGASLWLVGALAGLIPFLSHRVRQP